MSFPAFRNHVGLPKILRTNNHFGAKSNPDTPFFQSNLVSLCVLCVLSVSVVNGLWKTFTTEAQRTQRLHREETLKLFAGETPAIPKSLSGREARDPNFANQENS